MFVSVRGEERGTSSDVCCHDVAASRDCGVGVEALGRFSTLKQQRSKVGVYSGYKKIVNEVTMTVFSINKKRREQ